MSQRRGNILAVVVVTLLLLSISAVGYLYWRNQQSKQNTTPEPILVKKTNQIVSTTPVTSTTSSTPRKDEYQSELAWSPDHTQAAYIVIRSPQNNYMSELWIQNKDGTKKLVYGQSLLGGFKNPRWSDDGKYVLIDVSSENIYWNIVVNVDTGEAIDPGKGSSFPVKNPYPEQLRLHAKVERWFTGTNQVLVNIQTEVGQGTSIEFYDKVQDFGNYKFDVKTKVWEKF